MLRLIASHVSIIKNAFRLLRIKFMACGIDKLVLLADKIEDSFPHNGPYTKCGIWPICSQAGRIGRTMFHVPAVYPRLALWAFLAYWAQRKMSKLRVFKSGSGFKSHRRLRHQREGRTVTNFVPTTKPY